MEGDPANFLHLEVVLRRIAPRVLEEIEMDPLMDAVPGLPIHEPVLDLPNLSHTSTGEPRLLPHFTQGGVDRLFAGLHGPLRQGPYLPPLRPMRAISTPSAP